MRVLIFAIIIMLFGCAAQENTGEITSEIEAHEKKIDTSSLSFSRDNTSVMNSDTVFPDVPQYDFSKSFTEEGNLIIYYFYSSNCLASNALEPEIKRLESEYPKVVFLKYNFASQNGLRAYRTFTEQYNLSGEEMLVPQVLVNGTIITDRFNINKSLEGIIKDYSS